MKVQLQYKQFKIKYTFHRSFQKAAFTVKLECMEGNWNFKIKKGAKYYAFSTCWSLGRTSDGLPSSVTNVDKKTPINMGEKRNCNTKHTLNDEATKEYIGKIKEERYSHLIC